ncbi:MAG: hypothetical protein PF542_01635 [Nanoarchaeota archaeon]|jgi:hypothetical protein|nr:hypothetical protein [Nanoarchaeota archaeon]
MNINNSKVKLETANSFVYKGVKTFLLDFIDLDLDINLKELFIFEGIKMFPKNEFHLTIIGNENGKIISEYLEEKGLDKNEFYLSLKKDIINLLKDSSFSLKDEFHVLKKEYSRDISREIRYSTLQIIETKLIEKVYSLLLDKYGIDFNGNFPEPHVTIYKQLENFGIGLNSKDDLEKYSIKKVENLFS